MGLCGEALRWSACNPWFCVMYLVKTTYGAEPMTKAMLLTMMKTMPTDLELVFEQHLDVERGVTKPSIPLTAAPKGHYHLFQDEFMAQLVIGDDVWLVDGTVLPRVGKAVVKLDDITRKNFAKVLLGSGSFVAVYGMAGMPETFDYKILKPGETADPAYSSKPYLGIANLETGVVR